MGGSVNKAIIIGNVGQNPDVRTMQNGKQVATLSVATSESWKDKNSGEKREKTEWHKVVIFNEHLVKLCQDHISKGTKLYIEGAIETRKWQDNQGADRYSTEIVLRPYKGEISLIGSNQSTSSAVRADRNDAAYQAQATQAQGAQNPFANNPIDDDDDIPF